jgi:SAM-dependent methyltransferase
MPLPDHTLLRQCPVCGGQAQTPWRRKNGYDVVQCPDCGFIYTRDLPSEDSLRRLYESHHAPGADGHFQPRGGIGRRIKYRLFALWLRRLHPGGGRIRTLEIGFGQGDFLRAVQRDSRFDAQGLDYAQGSVAFARSLGLRVECGSVQSARLAESSFDLVVALHVLEHVRDLESTIGEVRRILGPGGLFFAVCPCVTHLKARWAGERWKYLGPPFHLWYFSPATLSKLLEKAGFQVLLASCFYHRAHVRILAKK